MFVIITLFINIDIHVMYSGLVLRSLGVDSAASIQYCTF